VYASHASRCTGCSKKDFWNNLCHRQATNVFPYIPSVLEKKTTYCYTTTTVRNAGWSKSLRILFGRSMYAMCFSEYENRKTSPPSPRYASVCRAIERHKIFIAITAAFKISASNSDRLATLSNKRGNCPQQQTLFVVDMRGLFSHSEMPRSTTSIVVTNVLCSAIIHVGGVCISFETVFFRGNLFKHS
jgi:hypothetical protein